MGGCHQAIRVHLPDSLKALKQPLVAGIGLSGRVYPQVGGRRTGRIVHAAGAHAVRSRVPVHQGAVDHGSRNGLRDDALHHLGDHALVRQAARTLGVAALELVAQVPVRKQFLAGLEQALSLLVHPMVCPQVVGRDITVRSARGLGHCQRDMCRYAPGKEVDQTRLRPLSPGPERTGFQPFRQRSRPKIEQHHKGQLVVERIVYKMGARIVARQNGVQRQHALQIEIGMPAQIAADLMHVAVQALQHKLQTRE